MDLAFILHICCSEDSRFGAANFLTGKLCRDRFLLQFVQLSKVESKDLSLPTFGGAMSFSGENCCNPIAVIPFRKLS